MKAIAGDRKLEFYLEALAHAYQSGSAEMDICRPQRMDGVNHVVAQDYIDDWASCKRPVLVGDEFRAILTPAYAESGRSISLRLLSFNHQVINQWAGWVGAK